MNVLSLFDGISCGQLALKRAGIKYDNYFASEINSYSINITMSNFKKTIQVGDVEKLKASSLPKIDLIIGGSPCQGFSFAGKQLNFNDVRSKLFFEYVRLLRECKPNYFLLENVKMVKESEEVISKMLKVEPIEINSSYFSAQNRRRLYWTNIPFNKSIPDKGMVIKDILRNDVSRVLKPFSEFSPVRTKNYYQFDKSGKGYKSQGDRAYYLTSKMCCLPRSGAIAKCNVAINNKEYHRLDLSEAEMLQTIPIGYTTISENFSVNKSFSSIGDGWTVDVIAHILKGIK